MTSFRVALAFVLACLAQGCGYTLQTSENPLALREGVRKVYLKPVINNTYKVGIENLVYNALLKTLTQHRRLSVVQSVHDADAILGSTVVVAEYVSRARGGSFPPDNRGATIQYNANLTCDFYLNRVQLVGDQTLKIWGGTYSSSRAFPSAVQGAVRGQTTTLINETEFDRALTDLVRGMMFEVHESMLGMF